MTRKVTRGLANVAQGLEQCLFLGNMNALRDWGHAKDYVRMQWLMLQQPTAVDYVIATGTQYSIRDFVTRAARQLGISLVFEGEGIDEVGIAVDVTGDDAPAVCPGDVLVRVDPRYFRPSEVETLCGNPARAADELGWVPEISLDQMIAEMVAGDLELAKRRALLQRHGYHTPQSIEA